MEEGKKPIEGVGETPGVIAPDDTNPSQPSEAETGEGEEGDDGSGTEKEPEVVVPSPMAKPALLGSPTAKAAVRLAEASGSDSDLQKKFLRAERFGIPVYLSDEEKRSSRAERFGTASSPQGTSEEKRKSRAERFGTVESPKSDDEARKKARLVRFAEDVKPNIDSVEEEKKKARTLRFSHPTSTLGSSSKSESDQVKSHNLQKDDTVGTD